MDSRPVPYRRTIFVCTNVRPEGRIACGNRGRGGEEILALLKDGVKAAGLKGKVRVARSGCLDLCEKGPNLFVYPGGKWLCGASVEDVPKLLQELSSDPAVTA